MQSEWYRILVGDHLKKWMPGRSRSWEVNMKDFTEVH
jgi:hypothetical protein